MELAPGVSPAMPKESSQPESDESTLPGMPEEWIRTLLSLVIFIHLFCCGVAMCANFGRSGLQDRLLDVLAPYMQFVHQDLGYSQYYLTNGYPDSDAFLEFQPVDATGKNAGEVVRLPSTGLPGTLPYAREQQLAARMSQYAVGGDDMAAFLSEMARTVGAAALRQNGWSHLVIRVRRHLIQPISFAIATPPLPADPNDPRYFETAYEATVWFDDDGSVLINKKESAGESAPVSQSSLPPKSQPSR